MNYKVILIVSSLAALIFFKKVTLFSEQAGPREITNHAAILQEMKENSYFPNLATQSSVEKFRRKEKTIPEMSQPADKYTQTEAYLSVVLNKSPEWRLNPANIETTIRELFDKYLHFCTLNPSLLSLISSILENEKKHQDFYVFYHAYHGELGLLFDIYNELYQIFFITPTTTLVMRDIFKNLQGNYEANVTSFLNHNAAINDVIEPFRSLLLSVNLALFGNIHASGESSFYYFITNASVGSTSHFINNFFTHWQFQESYKNQIIQLYKSYKLDTQGHILQIFIPSVSLDCFVYLSAPFGKPYNGKLTASFNESLGRHTDIVSILKTYRNEPLNYEPFIIDQLQARIYLTPDFFNPENGIKIFRFTSTTQDLTEYKRKLRELVRKMLIEWLENPENKVHLKKWRTPLGQLMEYLKISLEQKFSHDIQNLSNSLMLMNLFLK